MVGKVHLIRDESWTFMYQVTRDTRIIPKTGNTGRDSTQRDSVQIGESSSQVAGRDFLS